MLTKLKIHNKIGEEVSAQIYIALYYRARRLVSGLVHDRVNIKVEYHIAGFQTQDPLLASIAESL